jgi:hypothetical protein
MTDVGRLPLGALAEVRASSEDKDHAIVLAFDDGDGPGSTFWKAGDPGEQTITVAFREACRLSKVSIQVEEREVTRTQEVQLAVSTDGGLTYRELLRQEFTFSPNGATWEEERWTVPDDRLTHVRLVIKPDKGRRDMYATLTSFGLWVYQAAEQSGSNGPSTSSPTSS